MFALGLVAADVRFFLLPCLPFAVPPQDRPQGRVLGVHICGAQAGHANFTLNSTNPKARYGLGFRLRASLLPLLLLGLRASWRLVVFSGARVQNAGF